MHHKSILQYLELLKVSGIQDIHFKEDFSVDTELETVSTSLETLRFSYQQCTNCDLAKTRNNFVYGNGSENAKLMLIGEGPGEQEDKTGKVFVGKAGQLLTKMLNAIDISREEVFITNIVKCRPPGNRNPQQCEIDACLQYLMEQIELIKPKLLLLLGRVAAVSLFHLNQSLKKYREKPLYFHGIKTFVTYHPSALLRNEHWKRPAWEDLKKLKIEYFSKKL